MSGDVFLQLALLVTGVILGIILNNIARRPRVEYTGGTGSGRVSVGSRELVLAWIQIRNNPSFFGFPINRETARIDEARVFDPELDELVGAGLVWEDRESLNFVQTCELESGREVKLYLFAKEPFKDEYFVFHAESKTSEPPRSTARYTDKKKEFVIKLRDANGRRYQYPITVRNKDQLLNVIHPRRRFDKVRAIIEIIRN